MQHKCRVDGKWMAPHYQKLAAFPGWAFIVTQWVINGPHKCPLMAYGGQTRRKVE